MNRDPSTIGQLGRCIQIAGWLAACLLVLQVGQSVVAALVDVRVIATGWLDFAGAILRALINEVPYLCILPGLLAMVRLGERYRDGECFTHRNALLIREFGFSLLAAAFAFFIARPTLLAWTGHQTGSSGLGIDEGGVAMAVAGIFVTAMAQVMVQAAELQDDSDRII